jgi:hypothetical protein
MKQKVACFLIPLLSASVLLYQLLANLQIAVRHGGTLVVIGVVLASAAAAGALAAFGPQVVRVGVLAVCALLFLDLTFHLPGVFDHLRPEGRRRVTRDEKRVADLHRIQAALGEYVARIGPLPTPADYGEGTGQPTFWEQWWDVSSEDGDRDGHPFLDFLVDDGILPVVPVDPVNARSPDGDPRGGRQYVYFVVPPLYDYAGGTCDPRPERWHYMLAITDLEEETGRPPVTYRGSGCDCLWREQPNFFQRHFDYILCGTFDSTAASRAHAVEVRAQRAAAARARIQEAARAYGAEDRRRIADLLRIKAALQSYIRRVGPLPRPAEYGEAEASASSGFWQGYWDVSSEDGDRDGKPFLDFLVDSGTMASVPVDPDNQRAPDGDPRGGRQYVYFVAPPTETYQGGTCGTGTKEWVYLLGITDLRSQLTRPVTNVYGSGCECLWRDQPDFFRAHFDYITCGTFAGDRAGPRAEESR